MISSLEVFAFIKWFSCIDTGSYCPRTHIYSPVFISVCHFEGFTSFFRSIQNAQNYCRKRPRPILSQSSLTSTAFDHIRNRHKIVSKSVFRDTYSGWYGSGGKKFSLLSHMLPNFSSHLSIKCISSRYFPSVQVRFSKSKSMLVQG